MMTTRRSSTFVVGIGLVFQILTFLYLLVILGVGFPKFLSGDVGTLFTFRFCDGACMTVGIATIGQAVPLAITAVLLLLLSGLIMPKCRLRVLKRSLTLVIFPLIALVFLLSTAVVSVSALHAAQITRSPVYLISSCLVIFVGGILAFPREQPQYLKESAVLYSTAVLVFFLSDFLGLPRVIALGGTSGYIGGGGFGDDNFLLPISIFLAYLVSRMIENGVSRLFGRRSSPQVG